MFKQIFATLVLAICAVTGVLAQQDPILFSVQGVPVHASEFTAIYTKTNQDKADFSRASLEEYLDLYIKFKLKVHKARDLRLDTVPALKTELEGYRRQLAASYLVDKEVTDKLVREAWERMQQDVDISHIFFAVDKNAPAKDTLRAYNRAMAALKLLQSGKSFEQVAADSSDDKTAKETKGNIGFVTAMLPDGFYTMEKGIYSAKPGTVIPGLIRSNSGYHIVRVNATRPARGEIEVSQILVRKGDTPEKAAKAQVRIDSIYNALRGGANWDALCAAASEDKMTAGKGGYIGFFGINRYQRGFEDAAFGLAKDGDYSKPVETTIGWHIIKRVSLRPVGSFESLKRALADRVKRDSRSEVAKQSIISRIQRDGNFQEDRNLFNSWTARQVDSIFHTFKWKPDPSKPKDVLFQFGKEKVYTVADFEEYLARAGRERMRGKGYPVTETVGKLYKTWKDEVTLQYEETQLDKKYPDFKALMREYEEGMLLFEAAKIAVWDRANTDTTGLEKFYNSTIKGKYMWEERARVSLYTLKTDDPKVVEKVTKMAAKKPTAEVLKKFNKSSEVITVIERTYEKGKNADLANMWKAGALSAAKTDAGTKTATFTKVEEIMAPSPKALNEARGYAVADYQDYLEKQWIEELRKMYKVEVNKPVFESLIRK